jgi:molybdenum cofactor cytidylyltransferase
MTTPLLAAVILAAGRSSRMGRHKALLPLGEKPVIGHSIDLFRKSGVKHIRVVIGHQREAVAALLKTANVTILENPNYSRGMFSSVQVGLTRLDSECEGVFVLPVDMALIRPWTIRALIRGFIKHPGHIFHPMFQKKRGHPPLIPRWKIPEIIGWSSDGGLRACLEQSETMAKTVAVPDRNILLDMDTPGDYQETRRRWQRREIPSEQECDVIATEIYPVSESVRAHCRRVAQVADAMASALVLAGARVDTDLVHAAALLHDLAKGCRSHAQVAGAWLGEMGYARTGAVVAAHSDIVVAQGALISEAEIVFLADKCVDGDRLVTLEQRFQQALTRFGCSPEIGQKIRDRKDAAIRIRQRFQKRVGHSIQDILSTAWAK